MIRRQAVLNYARTLLGTPFRHQGRLPGVGLDCVGVVVAVARHFGFTDHDLAAYPRYPDGVTLTRELEKVLEPIPVAEVQPGDVLTFWVRRSGRVQHAALATDVGLLHAYHSVHPVAVVETAVEPFWAVRVAKAYRFPGVETERYPLPWPGPKLSQDPRVLREAERRVAAMGRGCCGH